MVPRADQHEQAAVSSARDRVRAPEPRAAVPERLRVSPTLTTHRSFTYGRKLKRKVYSQENRRQYIPPEKPEEPGAEEIDGLEETENKDDEAGRQLAIRPFRRN